MQSQWSDLNKLPEIIPTECERTENNDSTSSDTPLSNCMCGLCARYFNPSRNISNNRSRNEKCERSLSTIHYVVAVKFTCVNNKDEENKQRTENKNPLQDAIAGTSHVSLNYLHSTIQHTNTFAHWAYSSGTWLHVVRMHFSSLHIWHEIDFRINFSAQAKYQFWLRAATLLLRHNDI